MLGLGLIDGDNDGDKLGLKLGDNDGLILGDSEVKPRFPSNRISLVSKSKRTFSKSKLPLEVLPYLLITLPFLLVLPRLSLDAGQQF